MPVISYYVPIFIRMMLWIIILSMIISKSNLKYTSKIFLKVLPIFLIPFLNIVYLSLSGDIGITNRMYELMHLLMLPLISLFLINTGNKSSSYRLVVILGISYLITAITTYSGNILFPGASRLLATGMGDQVSLYKSFLKYNIGGFDFTYTIVLLIPIIIYLFKNSKHTKIIYLAILIVLIAVVIKTEYTTAFIFTITGLLVFFLPTTIKPKRLLPLIIIFLALSFVVTELLQSVLSWLSSTVSGENIALRLSSMSDMLSGKVVSDESDLANRSMHYTKSINDFLSSPFIGTGMNGGGHSFLLDNMAKYGLFGLFLYIIMFRYIYKIFIKPFAKEKIYGHVIYVFLTYIALTIVNPQPYFILSTFLLPLFCFAFSENYQI